MPAKSSHRVSRSRSTVPKSRRYAVIMAGGVGSRFWPWSRQATPKQLLPLVGDRTMLTETVRRLRGVVPDENVIVVTSERLAAAVRRDLPQLGRSGVLAEPVGRNTAPCIAWAAATIHRRNPDAVMAVLPADHRIAPVADFRRCLVSAFGLADERKALVTFGVPPTGPETGYGYIEAGPRAGDDAYAVRRFHEKPSLAKAKSYIAKGKFFWNSGMFVWRADVILAELETSLPKLSSAIGQMVGGRVTRARLAGVYPGLRSISIDHGLLEKSKNVLVVPASFDWNDVGSWDAMATVWPRDAAGNAVRGELVSVDSRGNIVAAGNKRVALLGVQDLVVIDTGDALLVCPRDRSQDVREVVAELEKRKFTDLL